MELDKILEIIGMLVGLAYLYFEYKADYKVWIAGIIMPAISMYVYFKAGLYADFGIDVYYLLAAIYGFCMWTMHKVDTQKAPLPITNIPLRQALGALLGFVAVFALIAYILINFTNSTVPMLDAFTTALSIVGMWALARKYIEQWLIWIVVDIVSAGLYCYKAIYFYAFLYTVYTIIAFFGYRKWRTLMK